MGLLWRDGGETMAGRLVIPELRGDQCLWMSGRALDEGREPNAVAYLDMIDKGEASAAQVGDFATYLGKRGMVRLAVEFQEYALKLDPQSPILWLNQGTLQSGLGRHSAAESSYFSR